MFIRADASLSMGAGHIMRCLALAQAAIIQKTSICMIVRTDVSWVETRLKQGNITHILLPEAIPSREDPKSLIRQLRTADIEGDWVVLDGYHFGLNCQQAVRAAGYKLLVIDDQAHLPGYSCDILLNQNISAEEFVYKGDIGQKLLGPKYALLRSEFLADRQKSEARQLSEKARNILLTLGGGDFSEHLARISIDFAVPELSGCVLRVIAGAMPPESISRLLWDCPAKLEILDQVDDMPALLLDTDFCVTAGGSTCWELCCLGVPFLMVETAKNQRANILHLATLGLADIFSGNSFKSALKKPIDQEIVNKLMALVDGKGCQRVLVELDEFPHLFLRAALPEDCMTVLALANDTQVRENAFSNNRITEEEHVRWYSARLKAKDSPFFVAFSRNILVGYVRYDITDTREERVVTIAIAEKWRGQGVGVWLLRESARHVFVCGIDSVIAWVKPENKPSRKIFQQAGYIFLGQKQYRDRIMCCFQLRVK